MQHLSFDVNVLDNGVSTYFKELGCSHCSHAFGSAALRSAERCCNHKLIAENETLYENVFYEHGNPIVPSGFNHMFNVNDPAPESGIANTSKW